MILQEEVEQRTVTLVISTSRMSANLLKTAVQKYLQHRSNKKAQRVRDGPVTPRGKQSVKDLVGQNQGVQNIEINDGNIKDFDRAARKYGIDYALKKDTTEEPPKYLVFFKARDGDALNAAFREYSAVVATKELKPSVVQKIRQMIPLDLISKKDKVKHKDKGLEL